MTTVVWDGNQLACDKQFSLGFNKTFAGSKPKYEIINNELIAWAGNIQEISQWKEWWKSGADVKEFPNFEDGFSVLRINRNKELFIHNDINPYSIEMGKRKWALGSGEDFAIGAMEFGANAIEALEVAANLCNFTGQGMDVITYDEFLKQIDRKIK